MNIFLFNILLGLTLTCFSQSESIHGGDPSRRKNGMHIEGDMILTEAQFMDLRHGNSLRNGKRLTDYRWPNNTVIYQFESTHTPQERNIIKRAMRDIERDTSSCVKFVERTNEEHYVAITNNRSDCVAHIGYIYPVHKIGQWLNLGHGCISTEIIIHELMHTLGFHHMHNAHDRDDYVKINWENIEKENRGEFKKYKTSDYTEFGQEYDLKSIMHYGKNYFSKNGKLTIVPHDKRYLNIIGTQKKLSKIDIIKVKTMYGCKINKIIKRTIIDILY